jgi:hypothetical protein
MSAPLPHVQLLCSKLLCNVVVRVLVVAKKQSLPNEIDRIRAAAETTVYRIKAAVIARNCCNCGVIIRRVVEDKVA